MIASPRHTLAELASPIDHAFAHWDHAHLHAFDFGEQGHYQLGGDEFSPDIRNSVGVHLSDLGVGPGSVFEYVFDLGEAGSTAVRSKRRTSTRPGTTARRPSSRCRSGAGAPSPTSTAGSPSRAATSSLAPGLITSECNVARTIRIFTFD
ncbi:MAG: IS1096 element passenger TnpR family protein [Actinomycetota bacterium]